ncbi:MAG: transcription initiation factor IIB family protein [Candidatus Caldarchaeum sp.]
MNCPVCGATSHVLDSLTGEVVCSFCGAVIEEKTVSTKATQKMLANSRGGVGPPVTELLHDKGIGTIRSGRFSPRDEKLLVRLLGDVFWVADKICVPREVAETAGELARKAVATKAVKKARKTTAAALVYISCSHHGFCRTLEDIASNTDIPVNQLNREVGRMVFGLKIKVKPLDVSSLIERISRSLELSHETTAAACEIYRISTFSRKLAGRKPSAISAAAVYIACRKHGVKTTMTQLAEAGKISLLTLRKTITLLESILEELRNKGENNQK